MKNLKKVSRINLKHIKGGAFVACTLPDGRPTRCRNYCPSDYCNLSTPCELPSDLCQ